MATVIQSNIKNPASYLLDKVGTAVSTVVRLPLITSKFIRNAAYNSLPESMQGKTAKKICDWVVVPIVGIAVGMGLVAGGLLLAKISVPASAALILIGALWEIGTITDIGFRLQQ
ncbi:MAG: hypothetical protein V4492_07890 [Chlamydiota bacterium]